jgi:hypothetical protein
MHAHAHAAFFNNLAPHVRAKYVELLRQLDRLGLGCRCEMVEGRDFSIVVGFGLSRPQFWMDLYGVNESTYPLT